MFSSRICRSRPILDAAIRSRGPIRSRFIHVNSSLQGSRQVPPIAFVFDIDGVLIRGEDAIPAAKRALTILEKDNPFGTKIPYILLTNGGGVGEEERCKNLTKVLGFEIHPTQYVQAHTILKTLAHEYADDPVLVLGGKLDGVRKVAQSYGFKKAYTTSDVLVWNPSVWPFHQLTPEEKASAVADVDFSRTPIKSVFVFHDPRNWALDVQILCDIIQSGGIIGNPYLPLEEQLSSSNPQLIFCNPDLLWRADFERPRLGQGAFKEAFQAVYKALTGSTYPYTQFGKPTRASYEFAEKVLVDRLQDIYGRSVPFPQVYMVGDNPESDIAGANAASWPSVLVHTGVYDPQHGPPRHEPTHSVGDVEEAVSWAIQREFEKLRQ